MSREQTQERGPPSASAEFSEVKELLEELLEGLNYEDDSDDLDDVMEIRNVIKDCELVQVGNILLNKFCCINYHREETTQLWITWMLLS